MMSNAARISIAMAIAVFACAAPRPAGAQGALELLPAFRSRYEAKINEIVEGEIPRVFLGTASVAPDRGFPWMVSLQLKGQQSAISHICGGIVIDRAWVLTAAHCVAGATEAEGRTAIVAPDAGNLQILVRSNVLSIGGELRPIVRIVVHPEYRITREHVPQNDLALLHIAGPADLTPMRLADTRAVELRQGRSRVGISGWGASSFEPQSAVSNNLLFAFVEVVERSKCNDATVYDGLVDDTMFCAGLGVADACQGDSGGPAVHYSGGVPALVGITSWGAGCGNRKYPGVYVNVAKFEGWINETIAASK